MLLGSGGILHPAGMKGLPRLGTSGGRVPLAGATVSGEGRGVSGPGGTENTSPGHLLSSDLLAELSCSPVFSITARGKNEPTRPPYIASLGAGKHQASVPSSIKRVHEQPCPVSNQLAFLLHLPEPSFACLLCHFQGL